MKRRISKKAVREMYTVYKVGYCDLQHLFRCSEAFGYSTRVEGWACDYYEIAPGVAVSTGYDTIGKKADHDTIKIFEEAAKIVIAELSNDYKKCSEKLDMLKAMLAEELTKKKLTQKQLDIYASYKYFTRRHGCRDIWEAYNRPSEAKCRAYRHITALCERLNGWGNAVCGASCYHFSQGFLYKQDGKTWLHYETHANAWDFPIPEADEITVDSILTAAA